MILLSGNIRSGSMSKELPNCLHDNQFDEKGCYLNGTLEFSGRAKDRPTYCLEETGHAVTILYSGNVKELGGYLLSKREQDSQAAATNSIVVFSGGNSATHPVYGGIDGSINNASAYFELYSEYGVCQVAARLQKKSPSVATFLSTHYRIDEYHTGPQSHKDVENFNLGMKEIFASGRCGRGNIDFIDVYNMTSQLVLNHYNESLLMTHDRMHWSRNVNLLKAQLVLDHFLHLGAS